MAALLLTFSTTLAAQTPPPANAPKEPAKTGAALKAAKAFTQPLHPVVGTVASGGGLGAGVGYDFPQRGNWQTSAETMLTINRYWSAGATATREGQRTRLVAYGRIRDMGALNFFGPGTNSPIEGRTLFTLRETVAGVAGSVRVSSRVTLGGRAEELWPQVSRARSTRFASAETRFGESDAPGIADQPRFGRYETFVDLISDAGRPGSLYQGGKTRLAYALFDDQQFDRYTFRRLDLETQHRVSVLGPHRLLTLHGWVSTTDADSGNDVPFFLQRTLGGKGLLTSVDESLLGTDGTDATLRGYRSFRFRDRHLLLLQAEYRWPIWGPIDATVFFDTGKVASRRGDLNLSDLKRSYGFSIGAVRGANTVLRMDVGFGSGEGTRIYFTAGRMM